MDRQRCLTLVALILPLFVNGCQAQPRARPASPPVSLASWTTPTCGGGPVAPKGNMTDTESLLASLINGMRGQSGLNPGAPDPIAVGVAQFHARNMSNSPYVGLVATDGEDPFRRLVCSGGPGNRVTAVIAVGRGSDPNEVFDVLMEDFAARSILVSDNGGAGYSVLAVGYSDGYWMIIMQQ